MIIVTESGRRAASLQPGSTMILRQRLCLCVTVLAAVLLIAIITPADAAPACIDPAQASAVRLVAVHPTETKEQTASRDEMDRIADQIGASAAVREAHPLMLITARAGTQVEVANQIIEGRDAARNAYFCDAPTSVKVLLGAFKTTIILHRNAATDPCIRQTLLEHQRQHSRALNETIDLFVDEHRDEFTRAIHDLMQNAAPDALSASQRFETGLAVLIRVLYQKFALEAERARLVADTPAALAQLRKACDGKLRRLELELGGPNARRASL
jgi:hypothetical protein